MRLTARVVLAASCLALLGAATVPSYADPGNGKGHAYGRSKPKPAPKPDPCFGAAGTHMLDLSVSGQRTYGFYALPAGPPKGIVVFAHGHGHIADDWQQHLVRTAARDGVIAVGMNYHGEDVVKKYGWRVREGAEDSVAAAQYLNALCPAAKTIVMYGVSMGGNTAGLAAALPAKRVGGAALFDYLFMIEPVANVTETYLEAQAVHAVLPTNATAAKAIEEIEQEMGGPFSDPSLQSVYLQHSVVTRGADIKAAGIKGVVLVHDIDDGQAGYNQSQEMFLAMLGQQIPVDMFTVATNQPGNSDDDTRLTGYATGNIPGWPGTPTAGHGSETSTTQLNITTGFDRLAALFNEAQTPHCRQFVVDGQTATVTPGVTTAGPC